MREKREDQESYPDADEHQKMQGVEFLLFRDIKGDDRDDHAGHDEERLKKVHNEQGSKE